jgi:hypothetical protein
MAKGQNGLLGQWTGRVGSVVGSVVHGEQLIRTYQPKVTNPNTPQQIEVRRAFKMANEFYSTQCQGLYPWLKNFSGISGTIKNQLIGGITSLLLAYRKRELPAERDLTTGLTDLGLRFKLYGVDAAAGGEGGVPGIMLGDPNNPGERYFYWPDIFKSLEEPDNFGRLVLKGIVINGGIPMYLRWEDSGNMGVLTKNEEWLPTQGVTCSDVTALEDGVGPFYSKFNTDGFYVDSIWYQGKNYFPCIVWVENDVTGERVSNIQLINILGKK